MGVGELKGPRLDEAWPPYFKAPDPNRATVIVSGPVVPEIVVEIVVEIVAHAHSGA